MEDNKFLTLEKLKKLEGFIPLLVGISYLSGFVAVNSFLTKYKIYTTSIFESEYLVAGIIFMIIFGVLFLSVYHSNENVSIITKNLYDFFLPANLRILLLSYTFCFLIVDSSILSTQYVAYYNYVAILIWGFSILLNQWKIPRLIKWILSFLVVISSNIFIFIVCKECRFLILLVIFYGNLGIYLISDIIEGKFHKVQIIGSILTFISLSMLFGFGVYDNIAKRFGGGRPEDITLIIDSQKNNLLPKNLMISNETMIKARLIHSSDKEYSLKQDSLLITLNKDLFIGYLFEKK
jgi:hypothetical protein